MWYINTQWIISKKNENHAICKNVGGPRDHYVKGNKSNSANYVLYVFSYEKWDRQAEWKTEEMARN